MILKLAFADDVGTYDSRGQEIASSAATLLQKAGISFGVITDALNPRNYKLLPASFRGNPRAPSKA